MPESITVADASQLCAAKRTDCVLVVDEDEGLSGIFTAKDLAFRVCTIPAPRLSLLVLRQFRSRQRTSNLAPPQLAQS